VSFLLPCFSGFCAVPFCVFLVELLTTTVDDSAVLSDFFRVLLFLYVFSFADAFLRKVPFEGTFTFL